MYDPFETRRARRRYSRYRRYQNPLRNLAGGIFLLFLLLGFALHGSFLVILFIGLAFTTLLGSVSSMNPRGIYGGIQGFIWMLGLAFCFAFGFWPWILLPIAVTMILGALFNPITAGLAGASFLAGSQTQQQPLYQESEQSAYQQGYQGTSSQTPYTYQEGGLQQTYPTQPKEQYEQPQVQYPEQQQELPPMEQH